MVIEVPRDQRNIEVPSGLPVEWWQLWDERAAIMEYDGNLPRERAEALALDDILKQMELARVTFLPDCT